MQRRMNFAKFSRTSYTIAEHYRATAWFYTIPGEFSDYAFLSVVNIL